MFTIGDGNLLTVLNIGFITYKNNNKHSKTNISPVDATNNPEKDRYIATTTKSLPRLKVFAYVRNPNKRNIFSKRIYN